MGKDEQLSLFGEAPGPTKVHYSVRPVVTEADHVLASRLPPFVRFGTSSWTFPGWAGLVYEGNPTTTVLARQGLAAYAQHPLLRAVSLDRSYYGPLLAADVRAYDAELEHARAVVPSLPPFRLVPKVWEEITTAVFPSHPRYGARAGTVNPHFLDAGRFVSEVLSAYRDAAPRHDAPFVFELTPSPKNTFDTPSFVARIETFLSRLPKGPTYAFELRNAEHFGARWLDMLRANGASHVFSYWTAMPSLKEQLDKGAVFSKTTIMRLMLPP